MGRPYFRNVKEKWAVEGHGERGLEEKDYECAGNQSPTIRGADVIFLQGGFNAHQCRACNEASGHERGSLDTINEKHCNDVEDEASELKSTLEVQDLNSIEAKTFPDNRTIIYIPWLVSNIWKQTKELT
jgi:hypothetical protein